MQSRTLIQSSSALDKMLRMQSMHVINTTSTYIGDSVVTESVPFAVAYIESICGRMRQGTTPTAVAR